MLRKLFAIFKVYLSECFAYPASSFIWVLADAQAAIILPAVWLAASGPSGSIGGMSHSELVSYYLCSMMVSQFVICHLLWDIAWEIREGQFSTLLTRPISMFSYSVARNLSWRITKSVLFIPLLLLVALLYGGIASSNLKFGWEFWLALIGAHTLSFVAAYCVAMIALWTTEFESVFRMYYIPELFLSGRLLPLATLPDWAQAVASFLPFQLTVSFPVQALMGSLRTEDFVRSYVMQWAWIGAFALLGKVLYSRGLRQYTGFGN